MNTDTTFYHPLSTQTSKQVNKQESKKASKQASKKASNAKTSNTKTSTMPNATQNPDSFTANFCERMGYEAYKTKNTPHPPKGTTRGSAGNTNRDKKTLSYRGIRGNTATDLNNNIVQLSSQQKTATRKSKRKSTRERAREAGRDSKPRV